MPFCVHKIQTNSMLTIININKYKSPCGALDLSRRGDVVECAIVTLVAIARHLRRRRDASSTHFSPSEPHVRRRI